MHRIAIMTGGGDAPGLNAVIRAVVRSARADGVEVLGSEDCFDGLVSEPRRLIRLAGSAASGLLPRGGTMLGTTNRGDPFAHGPDKVDLSPKIAAAAADLGLDGLVVVGGDGSMRIAARLIATQGLRIVGVPKTIDNDLSCTDVTFGFQSAVDVATDALDRLHTTAESHDRVMFLEVMGRDAGHIALHAGLAGGADVILIPELPYEPERVAAAISARKAAGRAFSIVVVAEGALPAECAGLSTSERHARLKRGFGAASIAMAQLDGRIDAEMRATVLGHVQRGGSPVPYDRVLATRLGVGAYELAKAGRWGEMAALRDGKVIGVPIAAAGTTRLVSADDPVLHAARAIGVEFGVAW